ncbi:NADPH-dependent FMN reductase [Sphingomonas abietis]|uniref:NAD(P)H-dependent oxidoreductase n=1 Tax=Sphingomonas abietis TaxID=3012344 RepID=A0ABY7NQ12_9SPHN|nr:NAD(P)H-dependent oxidoreductase [Sphingomonas abietis]WBO22561.1 NAD(P)H-dependent oxidoreductase [Sphingomonas abietis]
MSSTPFIVGIGGTTSPGSSTEQALQLALAAAEAEGARVQLFGGAAIAELPHYAFGAVEGSEGGRALVEAIRKADGLIIASPGYHGSISGLVKNAVDFIEETAKDARVYLDGLPVGLIVTAYGWQATGSTLATMRSIVHALRGWPTPLGAAIKSSSGLFQNGQCTDPGSASQLELVGKQVVEFARLRTRLPSATATGPREEG